MDLLQVYGSFQELRVIFWSPHNKDNIQLGSILGPPTLETRICQKSYVYTKERRCANR